MPKTLDVINLVLPEVSQQKILNGMSIEYITSGLQPDVAIQLRTLLLQGIFREEAYRSLVNLGFNKPVIQILLIKYVLLLDKSYDSLNTEVAKLINYSESTARNYSSVIIRSFKMNERSSQAEINNYLRTKNIIDRSFAIKPAIEP